MTAPQCDRASDQVTGRIFGQYITLQRCEWKALAAGDADILARAAEISSRPGDDRHPDRHLRDGELGYWRECYRDQLARANAAEQEAAIAAGRYVIHVSDLEDRIKALDAKLTAASGQRADATNTGRDSA